jgi:hypothetical protein
MASFPDSKGCAGSLSAWYPIPNQNYTDDDSSARTVSPASEAHSQQQDPLRRNLRNGNREAWAPSFPLALSAVPVLT